MHSSIINKLLFKKSDVQKIRVQKFELTNHKVITAKNIDQKTLWNIDLINNLRFDEQQNFSVEKNKPIALYGWAVDAIDEKPIGTVIVELNNERFKAKTGLERLDVSNAYAKKEYLKSGFLVTIPYSKFSNRKNTISLYLITSDKKYYYQTKEMTFYIFEKSSKNEKHIPLSLTKLKYNPKISIITPVYNPKLDELESCVKSIINQTYPNWELCIVDDCSKKKDVIKYLKGLNHPNIKVTFLKKNQGISGASNCAIKGASGEFIGFLDDDDILTNDALLENAIQLNKKKDIDIIYSDEAKINKFGDKYDYFFKPDYSPETLLSLNYICHFTIYRKKLVDEAGGLRSEYDGSQDYDLILRLSEKTKKIYHIPKVLYYWRATETSTAKDPSVKPYALKSAKKALEDYLKRNKIDGKVINISPVGLWQINYTLNSSPSVDIIIPTGPKIKLLKQCIDSILKKSTYKNYRITVIDNSFSIRTKDTIEEYKKRFPEKIRLILDKTKPFNFSKMCNNAAKKSDAEYLLFLNDDTKIINADWIEQMLQEATKTDAGVIGVQLIYPNSTIQHAGVVVGICGAADHAFRGFNILSNGYFGFHKITRNVSAVTFACAMTQRKKFFEVGGLDEVNFKVGLNDTDFSLKLIKKGYRNIYTPHAKVYHYESASRGVETIQNPRFRKEIKLFNKKWKETIENDPYYNPNLTKTTPDYKTSLIKPKGSLYEILTGLFMAGAYIIIVLI